jgi:hypothetical protein
MKKEAAGSYETLVNLLPGYTALQPKTRQLSSVIDPYLFCEFPLFQINLIDLCTTLIFNLLLWRMSQEFDLCFIS